jgi:hypothetical protein
LDTDAGGGVLVVSAGVTSGVAIDLDGEIRPQGLGSDLGADEYVDEGYTVFLPLVLKVNE